MHALPLTCQLIASQSCLDVQDYVLGNREGEVGLPVKADLHEVDMVKRRMQPCYWPGTTHRVIRGSWYVDKGSGYAPLKVQLPMRGHDFILAPCIMDTPQSHHTICC